MQRIFIVLTLIVISACAGDGHGGCAGQGRRAKYCTEAGGVVMTDSAGWHCELPCTETVKEAEKSPKE